MQKPIWKIVHISNRESQVYSAYSDFGRLYYKIGKPKKPEFGKLFAFRTLRAAIQYATEPFGTSFPGSLTIFKCSGKGVCAPPEKIGYGDSTKKLLRRIWTEEGIYPSWEAQKPPTGTICCTEVTLLEEVSRETIDKIYQRINARGNRSYVN